MSNSKGIYQIYGKQPDGSMAWITTDRKPRSRARRTSHQVMTDEMPATWSPFDGKFYTSKGRLRDAAKAEGLIEVGNEYIGPRSPSYDSGTLDAEIREAVNK